MSHLQFGDLRAVLILIGKWLLLGSIVGVLAGTASALFLTTLSWATAFRLEFPAIIGLLPLAGFGIGWLYHRFGGAAGQGNALVIEEIHQNQGRIPLRMAPLVLVGTLTTHLFGGSAGREGTALQMGASLADGAARWFRLDRADRRLMIMAGISGGFGAVFGTPIAGFVFGMEVQSVGRIRYDGVIPCLVAAVVGDLVTRAWGVGHAQYPALPLMEIDTVLLIKVAFAGLIFGITSILFVELTHLVKRAAVRFVAYPPLRPVIGGIIVLGLVLVVGSTDYLGLSLPLLGQSVNGQGVVTFAFLFKLVFTAVTLGTGFMGGEVTPLFVIGSTLGATLSSIVGVDAALMASIGFVAVFAGASNTPLACALMGIELFGGGGALYLIVGCFIAYVVSGHRSIYPTQVIDTPKADGVVLGTGESVKVWAQRRHPHS